MDHIINEIETIWWKAFKLGQIARQDEFPRICNLVNDEFCYNGEILKIYKEAWTEGWYSVEESKALEELYQRWRYYE